MVERVSIGYLPAAGVLEVRPEDSRPGAVFIAGDSRGDLTGAADECNDIARLYGVAARTGGACTRAALEACSRPARSTSFTLRYMDAATRWLAVRRVCYWRTARAGPSGSIWKHW